MVNGDQQSRRAGDREGGPDVVGWNPGSLEAVPPPVRRPPLFLDRRLFSGTFTSMVDAHPAKYAAAPAARSGDGPSGPVFVPFTGIDGVGVAATHSNHYVGCAHDVVRERLGAIPRHVQSHLEPMLLTPRHLK